MTRGEIEKLAEGYFGRRRDTRFVVYQITSRSLTIMTRVWSRGIAAWVDGTRISWHVRKTSRAKLIKRICQSLRKARDAAVRIDWSRRNGIEHGPPAYPEERLATHKAAIRQMRAARGFPRPVSMEHYAL